jgi:site-specific DNA-methyltransferase (adenine-specific)
MLKYYNINIGDLLMEIINKKISSLKSYKNNPRKISSLAVEMVANSINEFGIKQPLVIDKDNTIIVGHTRLKACKKLGIKEVPCLIADDLTQEQIDAYRLADNKTGEFSLWDDDKLSIELSDISIDMEQFGFELDLDDDEEPEVYEDDVPEPPEEPKSKLGQIYKLGEHRLMCGDSTSEKDVNLLMNGEKADLVITDPPYNVAIVGGTKDKLTIKNDSMEDDKFLEFLQNAFKNIENSLKDGGVFYVWFASREHINFENALIKNNLKVREELIWVKNSLVLGRQDYQWKHEPCLYGWKEGASHYWGNDRSQTTTIDFNRPTASKLHPTMKPVDLIAYQIENSSRKKERVLDLFGGSGTTLIASEQTNRKCRMMELDPKYVDVIIERWETLTGNKAELING